MSLNLLAVQDEIAAQLRDSIPQDVYETSPPEDAKLRFDSSKMILPYVVIQYSDMYPNGLTGGIIGNRYDVAESYIIISCVGPTERSARQVAGMVRSALTGFKPADAGELRFTGGARDFETQDNKANRFVVDIAFTFPVNTVW